jgi:hypothetical protein
MPAVVLVYVLEVAAVKVLVGHEQVAVPGCVGRAAGVDPEGRHHAVEGPGNRHFLSPAAARAVGHGH